MNQVANREIGAGGAVAMCAEGNGSWLLKSPVSLSSEAVRNVVACAVEKELPKVKGSLMA